MLSKRSQTQMTTFFLIPFKLNFRKDKTMVTESKSGVAQARSRVRTDYKSAQRKLWGDRNVLSHFGS